MDAVQLAACLAVIVLLASLVSVQLGVTVALVELTLGVAAGNLFGLETDQWLDFIAAFASIVLTFLAGMEVDPAYMRRRLTASVGIGLVSFIGPFTVASVVAYLALDWTARASLIAGTALSTTSLAVVYAVLPAEIPEDAARLSARLRMLTLLTGGRLVRATRDGPMGQAIIDALEEFRQSYVLRYVISGVPVPGWHALIVRVRGAKYTIRAREGYFGR